MSERETTKDILRQRLKEKRGGTQSNIETSSASAADRPVRGCVCRAMMRWWIANGTLLMLFYCLAVVSIHFDAFDSDLIFT